MRAKPFYSVMGVLALAACLPACGSGNEPDFHRRSTSAQSDSDHESGGNAAAGASAAEEAIAGESAEAAGQGAETAGAGGEPDEASAADEASATEPSASPSAALTNPSAANETAPSQFVAELDTTAGPIRIEVHREWAPRGADRFYNLVKSGYFTDVAFFRVISGFMAQTGIHGDPQVSARWRSANIPDDPVVQHNTRGMVSFAMAGPGSRTTQFFINLVDNTRLDGMGFAPFGRVQDMTTVERLNSEYGEGAPSGRGPAQGRIQTEGNQYLRADFPRLDYIRSARIVSSS